MWGDFPHTFMGGVGGGKFKVIDEPPRPVSRTIEAVTSTGNAGILPAINDYSSFFAGKMPAFPVEVIDESSLNRIFSRGFVICDL